MSPWVIIGLVLIVLGLGARIVERRREDAVIIMGLGCLVIAAWPS